MYTLIAYKQQAMAAKTNAKNLALGWPQAKQIYAHCVA